MYDFFLTVYVVIWTERLVVLLMLGMLVMIRSHRSYGVLGSELGML